MFVPADTKPVFIRESYKGADKLKGKVAIITGGLLLLLMLQQTVKHSVGSPNARPCIALPRQSTSGRPYVRL
jgi:hypothetical protein